jgi:DNA primase
LTFTLSNVNVSYANGLRRIILSEIPVIAIESYPHDKNNVTIFTNKSRLNNELIKQRLSCVPIHIDALEDFPYTEYVLEINKSNDTNVIIFITSEDFQIKNIKTGKYLTRAEVQKIFPPDPISGDYIDLLRLRPKLSSNNDKEQLHLEAKFTISNAKNSGMYNVVSTCSYGNTIDQENIKDAWTIKEEELKLKYSKEEIDAENEAEKIYLINNLANKFFQSCLNTEAKKYLNNRLVESSIIAEFNIGFAPKEGLREYLTQHQISLSDMSKAGLIAKGDRSDNIYEVFRNRVIFPIFNVYNKIIGFGGRAMDNNIQPKYLNSPETLVFKKGENFYGENYAISASYKKGNIILVEGYMDAITLHKAGFKNTVASLGTAVTDKQLSKLWRYTNEIILCLDPDEAGIKATKKVIEMSLALIDGEKTMSFLSLPKGLDPDDAVNKRGGQYLEKLITERKNLSEIIWQMETFNDNFSSPESRAKLDQKLNFYCNIIQNNILKKHYQIFFKDKLWKLGRKSTNKSSNHSNISSLNIDEYMQIQFNLIAVLCKHTNLLYNKDFIKDLHTLHFDNIDLTKFKHWLMLTIKDNDEIKGEITSYFQNSEITEIYSTIYLKQNIGEINIEGKNLWTFFFTNYELIKLQRNYDKIVALKGNKVDLDETRSYYQKMNILKNYIEQLKTF